MENERKYSLALVSEDGTTVLASLFCSPKYKVANLLPTVANLLPTDCKLFTLKEICFFTFCFGNSLALRYHLAQVEGCIDKSQIKSSVIHFATYDAKAVILDENGNVISETLLFSNEGLISREEPQNKFSLENPFSFFETLIFSKFVSQDHDYLQGIGKCICEILEQQNQYHSTPVLCERIDAINQFLNFLEFFKSDNDNGIPQATIIPEVLCLLLKKIFSITYVTSVDMKISPNDLDWEVILAIINYDETVTRTKHSDCPEDCGTLWRETYGKIRPRNYNRKGNKNYC